MNDKFDIYEPVRRSHKDLPVYSKNNFILSNRKHDVPKINADDRRYFEKEPSYRFVDSIVSGITIILILLGLLAYLENRDQKHLTEDRQTFYSNAIAQEQLRVELDPSVLTPSNETIVQH